MLIKYLRRRLAWCNQTGHKYDESEEQYCLIPRSLADTNGDPQTGSKTKWLESLQTRYNVSDTTPFLSALPPEWIAEVVIIDAMLCIDINPLRQHRSIEQYASLLIKQFAFQYYQQGTNEVHFIFDCPGRLEFNPKDCGPKRMINADHMHIEFTPDSVIPRPWRNYIQCRQCQRSIVETLGLVFLRSAQYLRNGQILVLAGCFMGDGDDEAWVVRGGCAVPQSTDIYRSNAQEAHMRVWRHATQTPYEHILIYSVDTDVINIGLTLVQHNHHFVVQTNLPQNPPKYIDMNKLIHTFQCDPDLASLPQAKLGSIMVQLYIVTGCDYISYIFGISKAMFLKSFFQYADFITGTQATGCLSQTEGIHKNLGYLALVRLIGTIYFKKHLATVVSKLGFETPSQLFHSIDPAFSDEEKHKEWYCSIKRVILVQSEDQRPPTLTSLKRHWMRSCWIRHMWENSQKPDQYSELAPPETQGWIKDQGKYSIDWEAEETLQQIQATLDFLDKGCTCKTGCKTKRCGCRKNKRSCGAGCECRDCANMLLTTDALNKEENEEKDEEEELESSDEELESSDEELQTELQTEVITDFDEYIDWF